MSGVQYVVGVAALLATAVPLVVGAGALRARLLPSWSGVTAGVTDVVLALGAVTLIGQVLGVAGVLERWTIVLACLALGITAVVTARGKVRRDPAMASPTGSTRPWWRRPEDLVAVAAGVIVAGPWLAQSIAGLRNGMQDNVDTLWYHGPMSARFAAEGSILAIHHFDVNPVTSYYPGGTSLLHAIGILLMGGDVLSPLVNLGFFALAVAAAWSIGRHLGSGAAGALGALVVLGLPMLVGDERFGQPGGEYNDVVGLAFVLASIALVLASAARGPGLVLAGAAAGLAAGTKLSMLAPVAALTLAVVVVGASRRTWTTTGRWIAAVTATGGYWYLRNVFAARSPLPGVELPLGPLAPPSIPGPPNDFIARHLTNGRIVDGIIIPGLDQTLGPAWWAILIVIIAAGCASLVAGRSSLQRALGGVVLLTLAAYLFTPTFIGTPPLLFLTTVRFAIVPLTLGMVLTSGLAGWRPPIGRRVVVAGLVSVVLVTQLDWRALWRAGTDEALLAALIVGLVIIGSVVVAKAPTSARAVAVLLTFAVVAGVWQVQSHQPQRRYASGFGADPVIAPLVDESGARIATQGFFLQYPLYGRDLSNHVQYLGRQGSDGGYRAYDRCRDWKVAVNEGAYDFLLVTADHYPVPPLAEAPEMEWADTEVGSGLREIARNGRLAASFEVVGELDEGDCP